MSGTPLARPDAWRLWWSFTWRQALVMVLSTLALGIVLAVLRWVGLPPHWIFNAMPYITLALLIYSGYESCRRLMHVYDIRLQQGGASGEQNSRQRR